MTALQAERDLRLSSARTGQANRRRCACCAPCCHRRVVGPWSQDAMSPLVTLGWQWASLGKALLAIAVVGVVSMSLCLAALRGRTRRG
jgi:hypothetical protein